MNLQLNTVGMTLGKSRELNENEESEKCSLQESLLISGRDEFENPSNTLLYEKEI